MDADLCVGMMFLKQDKALVYETNLFEGIITLGDDLFPTLAIGIFNVDGDYASAGSIQISHEIKGRICISQVNKLGLAVFRQVKEVAVTAHGAQIDAVAEIGAAHGFQIEILPIIRCIGIISQYFVDRILADQDVIGLGGAQRVKINIVLIVFILCWHCAGFGLSVVEKAAQIRFPGNGGEAAPL